VLRFEGRERHENLCLLGTKPNGCSFILT
jgi:hypothetical protein